MANPRSQVVQDGAGLTDGQLLGRFVERRDESAFAALVHRHGPMVWGVCHRLLGHHDAEDAFQATFIVLVRKAASVVPREMVANWLYGVAHQSALHARRTAARRGARERQVTQMPEPESVAQDSWQDLRPLLDQELSRLPDRYRAVVVLCDLEGKPRREVARQLGCPEGTVAGRLARARAMLARRLARHGLAVVGAALGAALAQHAASAAVPPAALASALKAANLLAAGHAGVTGAVSAKVAALTDGVLKGILLAKLKVVTAVLLAVGVLAVGGSSLPFRAAGPREGADKPTARQQAARPATEKQPPPQGEYAVTVVLTKLGGTRVTARGEFRGTATPGGDAPRARARLSLSGDALAWLTAVPEEGLLRVTLRIDPSPRPTAIGLFFDRGGESPPRECI